MRQVRSVHRLIVFQFEQVKGRLTGVVLCGSTGDFHERLGRGEGIFWLLVVLVRAGFTVPNVIKREGVLVPPVAFCDLLRVDSLAHEKRFVA